MQSAPTRYDAIKAMDMPTNVYLKMQGLSRIVLEEQLLVESDGEHWFNPDSVAKALRLDGLTEMQVNVKLCTGHAHCPSCKIDLAMPNNNGSDPRVSFFDFDIDTVRIKQQFACKKCRHEWGGKASGAKDFTLVGTTAEKRVAPAAGSYAPPAGGSVTGRVWEIADEIRAKGSHDWKSLRAAIVAAGEAAGIHPATVATQAAKWRKGRGIG